MIELIKQCLQHPAGSFGFVFSLLTLAFFLVHWITKKVTIINNSHSGINKAIDKLEKNIDGIRIDLSYVKGNLDIITKGKEPLAKAQSPISLTQEGLEKAKKINAENIISKNWDKIYDNLEKNIQNKNAYDIQRYCLDIAAIGLNKIISNEDIELLKKIAYNEGNSLFYYSPIFGILIRDKYLSLKGINVSEIDIHDPSKQTVSV